MQADSAASIGRGIPISNGMSRSSSLMLPGSIARRICARRVISRASSRQCRACLRRGRVRRDSRSLDGTCPGKTLAQALQERGPIGLEELVGHRRGAVPGVDRRASRGLVHQDVKAQNVMREVDGRLVLMDLGAGSGIGHDGRPQSGTPRYMAPELFDGGVVSVQSDIYSLARAAVFSCDRRVSDHRSHLRRDR